MQRLFRGTPFGRLAAGVALTTLMAGGQPSVLAATTGSVLVSALEFQPTGDTATFSRGGLEFWASEASKRG